MTETVPGATLPTPELIRKALRAVKDPELKAFVDKTLPVLTVSDSEGFAHSGGIIELFVERAQAAFVGFLGDVRED